MSEVELALLAAGAGLAGAIVGAVLSPIITARVTLKRDRKLRILDRRLDAYIGTIAQLNELHSLARGLPTNTRALTWGDDGKVMQDLNARIAVIGSEPVRSAVITATRSVTPIWITYETWANLDPADRAGSEAAISARVTEFRAKLDEAIEAMQTEVND